MANLWGMSTIVQNPTGPTVYNAETITARSIILAFGLTPRTLFKVRPS